LKDDVAIALISKRAKLLKEMKTKISLLSICGAACLFFWVSFQQNTAPAAIFKQLKVENSVKVPTEFHYKSFLFGILYVADAVLEDAGIREYKSMIVRHLKAKAYPVWPISKIFPFEVSIDSYIETRTSLPVMFKQVFNTKEKNTQKEIYYDQLSGFMQILGVKRSILPETYEPLSAIYKLRNSDLLNAPEFNLNINSNQKNYTLTGQTRKQNIRIKDANMEIFNLNGKIFRHDKSPYHRSELSILFSNDTQKIPFLIKIFASGFLITAKLSEVR